MKKILISVFAMFLVASTAYASVNGLYKGRPIVNVVVDGQKVTSTVPGQIVDNATLLPLRAIGEALGATVDWDQATYTASITTAQTVVQEPTGLSLAQLNDIGDSVGIIYAYKGDTYVGQGSGFVTNGHLITNVHVVKDATQFIVAFGKEELTFQVKDAVFRNEEKDLIGFEITGVKGLQLATVEPKAGDKVYSLGYPGRKFQISEGDVLAVFDREGIKSIVHNAPTNPGSSGGLAINAQGQIVGVTDSGADNVDINEAIPVTYLKQELNKIK